MGQSLGVDSDGVHRIWGQTNGQQMEPGRRGVEGTKIWELWTTVVARNHHQSGGGGSGACCSRVNKHPCRCGSRVVGPTRKITKIKGSLDLEDEVGDC